MVFEWCKTMGEMARPNGRWGAASWKHTAKQWREPWGAAPREPQGIKNPQKIPLGVKLHGLIALYFQTKPNLPSASQVGESTAPSIVMRLKKEKVMGMD